MILPVKKVKHYKIVEWLKTPSIKQFRDMVKQVLIPLAIFHCVESLSLFIGPRSTK